MQEKNELFSLKQQKSNVGYFYLCIFYLFGTHLRIITAAHSWHAPVSYFYRCRRVPTIFHLVLHGKAQNI